ncbi:MAG: hypothetical protein P8099_01235 [Gemmatimonadota bacterium]
MPAPVKHPETLDMMLEHPGWDEATKRVVKGMEVAEAIVEHMDE